MSNNFCSILLGSCFCNFQKQKFKAQVFKYLAWAVEQARKQLVLLKIQGDCTISWSHQWVLMKTLLHQRVSKSTKIIFDLLKLGVNFSFRVKNSDSGMFNNWYEIFYIWLVSIVNSFVWNVLMSCPLKTLKIFSFLLFSDEYSEC